MLLTVSYEPEAESADAGDLGYLLHKHPGRVQRFSAPVGDIHVFYPEVSARRCTAAVLLEVDPVDLVRSKRFRGDAGALDHYVNDRPYAASSMLAVALGAVFRTAMTGRCDARPELAASPLPLRVEIPVVSARGEGDDLIARLFEPCGWTVTVDGIPLDPEFPEWGASRYSAVTLVGTLHLAEALRQLYVLLPVLDDAKHYWVGDDEIAKLERAGEGWLAEHPERDLIARRYLLHQRSLLAEVAPRTETSAGSVALRTHRADAVIAALKEVGAHRVVDLGCGPGALLAHLAADRSFTSIVGVDVSSRALEQAARRLNLAEASDAERERIRLLHGSAVYRDARLGGFDAAVLMEVIEHVELSRLPALEDAVFAAAAPGAVIVTTPNVEYNPRYPNLDAGRLRHDDHRFEFTRAEFRDWADGVADRHGYAVEIRGIGPADADVGAPTQLAIFRRTVNR